MKILSSPIKIQELFLLGLGVILFGIVGALSLASIDSVPEDLVDNAAVLGALCLLTALVFIGDLLMSPPRKKDKQDEARILEKDLGGLNILVKWKQVFGKDSLDSPRIIN